MPKEKEAERKYAEKKTAPATLADSALAPRLKIIFADTQLHGCDRHTEMIAKVQHVYNKVRSCFLL